MVVLMVHLSVKPGAEEEFKRLCREMVAETLKEPGCLQYVVHQSTENPLSFSFYEQYEDEAALQTHWASPHFARYITGGINPLVESRTRELFVPIV